MSEVKHTSGPWVLIAATAEGGDGSDTFFVKAQPHSAMRGFTKDIAMVEGEANARLISAAPNLLEALKAAVGYMQNVAIDLQTGTPKKTTLDTLNGGLAIIRGAITKAEGRQ